MVFPLCGRGALQGLQAKQHNPTYTLSRSLGSWDDNSLLGTGAEAGKKAWRLVKISAQIMVAETSVSEQKWEEWSDSVSILNEAVSWEGDSGRERPQECPQGLAWAAGEESPTCKL